MTIEIKNRRNAEVIHTFNGEHLRHMDVPAGAGIDLSEASFENMDLSYSYFEGVNLSRAYFGGATLTGASFRDCNLSSANMFGVNARSASFVGADLRNAVLEFADLRHATFRNADLQGAMTHGVTLIGADLGGAKNVPERFKFETMITPEVGGFYGFKKGREDEIIKLYIPADAKRSNATERKCRASHAKVVSITAGDTGYRLWDKTEAGTKLTTARSGYDSSFVYTVGEYVHADHFDEDRWNQCTGGIHFFITEEEARRW